MKRFRYEIRVDGRLSDTMLRELAESQEVALAHEVLEVEDEAALFGLLRRFERLGIGVISVDRRD